jgi:hypothetical protein
MRVEEELDHQPLDRSPIVADLAVAVRPSGRVLEPVERALAGQRRAVRPPRRKLAGKDRQHRVMAQLVVVEEIFVAERDPDHPLADQGRQLVLDRFLPPAVDEAGCEPLDQADRPVGGAQQQRTRIRRDRPAVERRHHRAALDHSKPERGWATVCRHRGAPLNRLKSLLHNNFHPIRAPMHLRLVRNAG